MNLEQQRSTDRVSQNAITLLVTAAIMASFLLVDQQAEDRVAFVRGGAASMILLHSLLHLATLRGLDLMLRNRFPGAEQALELYRDPRRLSHLDLAAIWLGFFVLVRLVMPPSPEEPATGAVLGALKAFG